MKKAIPGIIRALGVALALAGLAFTLYGSVANVTGLDLLILDVIALALVGSGLLVMWYSTIHPVDVTLSVISRVVSTAEWILGIAGAIGAVLNVVDHTTDGDYETG